MAKDGKVRMKRMLRMEWAGGDRFAGGSMGTGTGGEREEEGGDVAAVLGIQLMKWSKRFKMELSCLWWMVAGASLTAHERKFKALTVLSPSVTMGWVR